MKKSGIIIIACLVVCLLANVFLHFSARLRSGANEASTDSRSALSRDAKASAKLTETGDSFQHFVNSNIDARQALMNQILALLAKGGPANINKVYNELLPALVRMDPLAAAAFAQSPEAAKWRSDLMMVVAQSWAKLNPDDAQKWASQLPNPPNDPTERDTMVSYVSFAIADTNPSRAVQVLEQCPINSMRREIMVENLAQQWAETDLQPLVSWISQLPAGDERDGLFARIANAQARTDAIKASTIVSENIAPGPIQAEAAVNVVKQWAWVDQGAASEWVNEFPPGSVHDRALMELNNTVALRKGVN
jgi:hypothetical protein